MVLFLKDIMRRRKRLPSQLAADLGTSHATVNRWLSGEEFPIPAPAGDWLNIVVNPWRRFFPLPVACLEYVMGAS